MDQSEARYVVRAMGEMDQSGARYVVSAMGEMGPLKLRYVAAARRGGRQERFESGSKRG